MKIGEQSTASLRSSLPDDHFLAVLMDEHVQILKLLDRLEQLVSGTPTQAEIAEAGDIGHELAAAEPHHQREEEVLFPALQRLGILGPPACMLEEHVELRTLKNAVIEFADQALDNHPEAVDELRAAGLRLVGFLREHIIKEDTILYPMAMRRIPAWDWTRLQRHANAIGYCCHSV